MTGRERQVIDPSPGGKTQYAYDVFGNLNQTIDAIGATSSATFNLRGFRTQMVDADAGTWNFSGDSLNELLSWTNAKNQSFGQAFDLLGRRTSRTEPEGTSVWTWGTGTLNGNPSYDIGRLQAVTGYGYSESRLYDSVSRLNNLSITTDQNYQFNYTYNKFGRVATISYPTSPMPANTGPNYTIEYQYSYGFPYEIQDITNAQATTTIWSLGSANDYSSPLSETIGVGSAATAIAETYQAWTDHLETVQSGTGSSRSNVQNLSYSWDVDDNLAERQDLNQTLAERFVPDALNRLSSSTLNGATNLNIGYDAAGDITTRSDVGAYTYGNSAHPHGVMDAGSSSYTYDANGNVASRSGISFTWASYNLPTILQASVAGTTLTSQLWYGPEHKRYKQTAQELNGYETTDYVGGLLEKMTATTTGLTYWRHYVVTPTGKTILVSRNSDLSTQTSLILSDHLGSSDAIVYGSGSQAGTLDVQESFSPFGLRRQSNWQAGVPSYWDQVAITESTRHGFTSQEHLDNVGLIHMNGRVYDPVIGRFWSVDPYPGEPGNSQALNPYSYVSNRPLIATDPSGFEGGGSGSPETIESAVALSVPVVEELPQSPDTSGNVNSTAQQTIGAPPPSGVNAVTATTVAVAAKDVGTLREVVVHAARQLGKGLAGVTIEVGTVVTAGAVLMIATPSNGFVSNARLKELDESPLNMKSEQSSDKDAEDGETDKDGEKSQDDVIKDLSKDGKDQGGHIEVDRGGGDQAGDFDKISKSSGNPPRPIDTKYGPGEVVNLKGGGTASTRPGSSQGPGTIQINRPGQTPIKIP